MAISIGVLGLGVSAKSAQQQKKATKQQVAAQAEQQRQQKKLADIKAQRERRKVVQAQLRARSAALVASGEQGADSRTAGVLGSVGTKAAGALGFGFEQQQISTSIFEQGLKASAASADLASAQELGQIGGALTSSTSIFNQ